MIRNENYYELTLLGVATASFVSFAINIDNAFSSWPTVLLWFIVPLLTFALIAKIRYLRNKKISCSTIVIFVATIFCISFFIWPFII